MIKKLKIKPYKAHKSTARGLVTEPIKQYSYRGVALSRKEQALFLKINELVKAINEIK